MDQNRESPGGTGRVDRSGTTALWSGQENGPVSGNAGQSNTDSHDSQFDPYIPCMLIKCVCNRMQHKC